MRWGDDEESEELCLFHIIKYGSLEHSYYFIIFHRQSSSSYGDIPTVEYSQDRGPLSYMWEIKERWSRKSGEGRATGRQDSAGRVSEESREGAGPEAEGLGVQLHC